MNKTKLEWLHKEDVNAQLGFKVEANECVSTELQIEFSLWVEKTLITVGSHCKPWNKILICVFV